MGKLKGKVAVVTGASSGIGRATAIEFSREGAKVIVVDIARDGGEQTVQMIKNAGGEGIFVNCDVSQSDQVEAMIDRTIQTYGRLDYAANNASINETPKFLVDISEKQWNRIIDIDLKSVWLCMKYEIPQMLKVGGGAIVNTASIAGLKASGDISVYVAAKHGVIGLTKAAAAEYGRQGIKINAVCPGLTETPLLDRIIKTSPPGVLQSFIEKVPLRIAAQPENMAGPIVWLCTESAYYVTGASIVVDGGVTIV